MSNWSFYRGLLLGVIVMQFIIAMIAEHNEEYTKAIYEMMWVGLFIFLLDKELKDE